MLRTLRGHSQSFIIYLFFGIIIVVFVFFFGPQSDGCSPGQTKTIATVGSMDIPSLQLEQMFGRISGAERGLPESDQIPPGTRRRQIVEDLILTRLLADEARAAGMSVSDEQFSDYIQNRDDNPDFRYYIDRTGEFDYERYEISVPGVFGISLVEYENWKEDELLAREYIQLLSQAVTVTPGEVQAIHRLRSESYDLEYVRFDAEELAELLALTEAEVAAALAADPTPFETYYAEHSDEFEEPRQLRVSRIFIRLPGESNPDGRAEALERYETALELVRTDPSTFADVAREYSQSTDADEGGDMGTKTAGAYASYPFLEDRLDDITIGEIETYESAVSRIIFRVEEDIPAVIPEFAEVAETVARTVLESNRGDEPVQALAQWFLEQAQTGLTLEEVALEHARQQAAQQESPVDDSPETDAVDDTEEPSDEPIDGADDEALEPILTVQRTGPFSLDEPGVDLSQFGPQFAGQFAPPREPQRIPQLGDAPELARQLTNLVGDSPVAPDVYNVDGAFIVARLADFQPADEEIDDDVFSEIEQTIWREKVSALFGNWEARLLYHQPIALGALLTERLNAAFASGTASLEESYFVNPEPVEQVN